MEQRKGEWYKYTINIYIYFIEHIHYSVSISSFSFVNKTARERGDTRKACLFCDQIINQKK